MKILNNLDYTLFGNYYTFPLEEPADEYLWSVNDAVVNSVWSHLGRFRVEDKYHRMLRHFGCLDAFLP